MRPPASTWDFQVRVLSPMFLGGADPNESATLRLPSLRGALRSWYRVLVGAPRAAGRDWPESLHEDRLFGGIAKKRGQGRQVLSFSSPAMEFRSKGQPAGLLAQTVLGRGDGLKYLGFTLNMGSNRRVAVPPGTTYDLRVVHPKGLDQDEARMLLGTWWLLLHLGGLGSRARRGFGALTAGPPRLAALDGSELNLPSLPDPTQATGLVELNKALADGLFTVTDWVKELARGSKLERVPKQPTYSIQDARVVVWSQPGGRGWRDAFEALDAIGVALSGFRRELNRDGLDRSTLRALLARESLPHAPHRAAFGLPLTYYKPGTGRAELRPTEVEGKRPARLPSPLWIRPYRCRGGTFVVLTRLTGELPGIHVPTREKKQNVGFHPADPDNRILDDFLDTLKPRREVQL